MDHVLASAKISMQTVPAVGIAVYCSGGHVGLLYRVGQGQSVKILHLCGHLDLRCDTPSSDYTYWIRPNINIDRGKAIAAFCRRIWNKNVNGQIPYGLTAPGQFFDFSGELTSGPAKIGLTCASFVLEVFDRAGLPLIKYDSWPDASPDDIAQQRLQLEMIRRKHPDEVQYLKAFENEIGNIRYAPLQVAGAGTADPLPSSYDYANAMAKTIDGLLNNTV